MCKNYINFNDMSPRKTLASALHKNTKASRESLCGVWLQPFKELTRLNKGNSPDPAQIFVKNGFSSRE